MDTKVLEKKLHNVSRSVWIFTRGSETYTVPGGKRPDPTRGLVRSTVHPSTQAPGMPLRYAPRCVLRELRCSSQLAPRAPARRELRYSSLAGSTETPTRRAASDHLWASALLSGAPAPQVTRRWAETRALLAEYRGLLEAKCLWEHDAGGRCACCPGGPGAPGREHCEFMSFMT